MDVHDFTWRKWRLFKDLSPLAEGMEEQVPGRIPRRCLDLLQPKLDPEVLAPPKRKFPLKGVLEMNRVLKLDVVIDSSLT